MVLLTNLNVNRSLSPLARVGAQACLTAGRLVAAIIMLFLKPRHVLALFQFAAVAVTVAAAVAASQIDRKGVVVNNMLVLFFIVCSILLPNDGSDVDAFSLPSILPRWEYVSAVSAHASSQPLLQSWLLHRLLLLFFRSLENCLIAVHVGEHGC